MQVFHGGDNDVLWLQRDFHIYVANMFDTERASQVPIPSNKYTILQSDNFFCVSPFTYFWRLHVLNPSASKFSEAGSAYKCPEMC